MSKIIFLGVSSGVVSLAIKKALKSIGIISILQFFSSRKIIEQVFCSRPHPDLIISETFAYNEIDGFEAAEFIWQKYNIPFIFLTSDHHKKIHIKSDSIICKFISIPFDEKTLLNLTRKLLKIDEADYSSDWK